MGEELSAEVMMELEAAYRFRPATQVGLMLILLVVGIWLITQAGLSPEDTVIVSVIYTALLYPLIIKIKNRLTIALSFGLFGAAIASIIYWLVMNMPAAVSLEAIALYVMFMEIVIMELFHHLCEEYVFYKRDWRSYLLVGILSAAFFACAYIFLDACALGSLSVVIAVLLTMMFAWAVLPEKPV